MLYCVRGIIGSVSVAIIACCIVVIKTKHKTIGTSDHVIHMDGYMVLYSREYLARLFKLLDRIPNRIESMIQREVPFKIILSNISFFFIFY